MASFVFDQNTVTKISLIRMLSVLSSGECQIQIYLQLRHNSAPQSMQNPAAATALRASSPLPRVTTM
jgi:hypothetical protein